MDLFISGEAQHSHIALDLIRAAFQVPAQIGPSLYLPSSHIPGLDLPRSQGVSFHQTSPMTLRTR